MLFIIYTICIAVQVIAILFVYSRLYFFKEEKGNDKPLPVSVVVAAHNEYENLKRLVPALMAQNHETFEVIIADDRSTDATVEYINTAKPLYSSLSCIHIKHTPEGISNKKYALTQAIQQAKYDILLFTDADCLPCSPYWITEMSKRHHYGDIVLGVGMYDRYKGWLNRFIQYETLFTAMQYLSFAIIGHPFMGVGRNLSYKKTLFMEKEGFEGQKHILSGDDDLLINKIANGENTTVSLLKESHTTSVPKQNFRDWFIQKKRHLTVGKYYNLKNKIILGLLSATHISVYFLSLVQYVLNTQILFVFLLFILRIVLLTITIRLTALRLQSSQSWFLTPLMDFLYMIYQFIVGTVSMVSKQKKWS